MISDLVVAFDAFHAIDGLDLTLHEHEVRFVIGPNGAGKTTLIDSITNLVRPTSGSILFAGEELVGRKEHAIVRAGIGRTFQKPSVFDELTVLENVDLAASFRLPFRSLLRGRKGVSDEVAEMLESVNLTAQMNDRAGSLSHGQKQWLEVAMVLVQRPRLLLLDEPVAGMTAARAPAHRRADHDDRPAGHDGARDRARHGLRAPLRAQGDRHARGQDPDRRDRVARCRPTRPCARSTSGRPRDARGAAEVLA